MRLCFVIQRYGLEVAGGSELHCRWLAGRLAGRHQVQVATTCALDYLEWSQLQAQVVLARRQQLAATVDAQRALIEIQRLTANGFDTAAARTTEILP